MIRVLIILIVVFLLPFLLYRFLLALFGQDKEGVNWMRAPLGALAFFGAVMSIGTVITLTLWSQGKINLSWLGL